VVKLYQINRRDIPAEARQKQGFAPAAIRTA
jgi:hypothetical protein